MEAVPSFQCLGWFAFLFELRLEAAACGEDDVAKEENPTMMESTEKMEKVRLHSEIS